MTRPNAPNSTVSVGKAVFSNSAPLALIAGPCQLESRQHAFDMAGALKEMCGKLGLGLVYKTSYDKANRTSLSATRGAGLEAALPIFDDLRNEFGLPVLTDVHTEEQCAIVAPYVDVLQIPAFLSRQTDLLVAAARTGKVINVKKGQFLAPWDMKNVVAKITGSGNPNVLVTERGASFGYNTLVSDMRALPIMAEIGAPVIFDATHSVQQPGGQGGSSGGERRFVETLARAAVAVGVAGVFIETHQDPDNAPLRRPEHGAAEGHAGAARTADGLRPGGEGRGLRMARAGRRLATSTQSVGPKSGIRFSDCSDAQSSVCPREEAMSVARVTEITASSKKSFQDAIEKGISARCQDPEERRRRLDPGPEDRRRRTARSSPTGST